jgi:redox-sensitive bicupin YhaK (pirin superfamily)
MITLRKAQDRGHANRGWLNSNFTFSFADYYDPAHMGFRALRVINDDVVQPGKGFGAHAHRDMEILTYVLEGGLTHRDSMGEVQTVEPNTIQLMSAGTGVVHSEFNASQTKPVHFLQVWVLPAEEDIEPSYQQISFGAEEKQGKLRLLAGPGSDQGPGDSKNSAAIHQDARIYASHVRGGERLEHSLAKGRHAWVQVAQGTLSVNGVELETGDGAALSDESRLDLAGRGSGAEFLLFDLA